MKIQSMHNEKGVTLVELLVALVIAAITLAGVYRVFISQTKTYAVQDQVVEVQQSVRSAMDIILRDLRMAGFDHDNPASPIQSLLQSQLELAEYLQNIFQAFKINGVSR